MNADGIKAMLCAGCAGFALCIGLLSGWHIRASLYPEPTPEVVTHAPEARQDDGSLVLERKPDPSPSPPPHIIPPSHVEERRISVQVQPDVSTKKHDTNNRDVSVTPACECKPVRVDLSLVRDTAGGRRVIASSPDGTVIGGLDVPIMPGSVFTRRKWAAGVSYGLDGTPGAWVERDYGRLRIGADIYQDRKGFETGIAVRLRIGWTF